MRQHGDVLIDHGADLRIELLDSGKTAARHCLEGAHDQPLESGLPMKWHEDGHRSHRRAVGVGDDALAHLGDSPRIDLAHHERHIGIHAPRGRVVDDDGPRLGELRGELLGRRSAGREQRDVDAAEVGCGDVLDDNVGALPREGRPGRTRGREVADLADGEVALLEQAPHDAADLAGGTDDRDGRIGLHRPVPA